MAAAAELFGDAEIERDGLGVADVQVAVRLWREPGHDLRVPLRGDIGGDDVADEVAPGFGENFARRHADPCCAPAPGLCANFTRARRDGPPYRTRAALPILGAVVHRLMSPLPVAGPVSMSETVVTRFAPSPTGFLHIGGARTALFNWLYARGRSGRFLLRIEDTDRARSTDDAIAAIFDGLNWLGLDWDSEPVHQFARAERHREVAEQLLAAGKAYYCYASPEELTAMREQARAEGRSKLYNGLWRDRDPSYPRPDIKPVIRLKAPLADETVIEDQVQGRVTWQNENLDDLVLLRSDGTPTYMLAVVVDDHDMDVTHIIRGDDHLTNAARQKQIYEALGWSLPVMAHIPLIHGPDGAKLSKRPGALGIEAYRAMGYLPVAMRNYLVRLGWSHGDQEIFSTEEMIAAFDLPQIGRSPARFDMARLDSLNGHYLRRTADADLVGDIERVLPHIADGPE